MVVVEARDEARAVLVLLVRRAGIPVVEMGVHDEVLITCGAAIHETPLSPGPGADLPVPCARTGHRMAGEFSGIRRTGLVRAFDVCSRRSLQDASSCGGAVTEGGRAGMRGAALRAAVIAGEPGSKNSSAPSSAPSTCSRRWPTPPADPGEGGRAAARDQPRHELPGAPHPRARGLRRPPRPRLLRPRREGHVALAPLPGEPRRGGDPPARPRAARPRRRRTPTSRSSAGARSRSRRWSRDRAPCTSGASRSGSAASPTRTALGKVLLAACPDDTIDDYLGQRHLRALTPQHPRRGAATSRTTCTPCARRGWASTSRRSPRGAAASPRPCATPAARSWARSACRSRRIAGAGRRRTSRGSASPPPPRRHVSPHGPSPSLPMCNADARSAHPEPS